MSINIGINGFGRIARVMLRSLVFRNDDVKVCAINVRNADFKRMAYLFEYDSVFGRFNGKVEACDDGIVIDGRKIIVFSESDPANIEWDSAGAEYIVESTGAFTNFKDCRKHLIGGGKKIILTAPSKKDDMPTFVYGVNHMDYKPEYTVVSNASCTTNCLAPLVKVVHEKFGIEEGLMSTIHASTSKQKPVDSNGGRDWRTGRSVFNNIIPSTTGAAKAVGKVMPEMQGKLTGLSFRVPTNDVSVVDLTAKLSTKTDYKSICAAIKESSEGNMKGIIEYLDDEIVSGDIRGNAHTCVFDEKAGIMLNDHFVKLIAWYDNEWGYSNKTLDMLIHMAKTDAKAEAKAKKEK
ncbi:MAG: type I glyceraldehyde-3-phosphate dehydrogenase [Lachnospiraceae bacterium]|nr:type I glyceraldehyde-3-phosphate dehydrogenase [Lachnospiraceae bacterium]